MCLRKETKSKAKYDTERTGYVIVAQCKDIIEDRFMAWMGKATEGEAYYKLGKWYTARHLQGFRGTYSCWSWDKELHEETDHLGRVIPGFHAFSDPIAAAEMVLKEMKYLGRDDPRRSVEEKNVIKYVLVKAVFKGVLANGEYGMVRSFRAMQRKLLRIIDVKMVGKNIEVELL